MSKITKKGIFCGNFAPKTASLSLENRAERRCSVSLKEVSQSFLFGEVYTECLWAATPNSATVNNNHLCKHGRHNIKKKASMVPIKKKVTKKNPLTNKFATLSVFFRLFAKQTPLFYGFFSLFTVIWRILNYLKYLSAKHHQQSVNILPKNTPSWHTILMLQ